MNEAPTEQKIEQLFEHEFPENWNQSPDCTCQACAFAGTYTGFKTLDTVVIGISKDSVASHQKFADKYDLSFILLSDPKRQAIEAYDVWQEKKNYGKISMGVVRSTFVIDKDGAIDDESHVQGEAGHQR